MKKTRVRSREQRLAERLGYRWLMKILRQMDKPSSRKNPSWAIVVHCAKPKRYNNNFKTFVAKCRPAAREAAKLLTAGCMTGRFSIERSSASPLEQAFTVTFSNFR